MWWSWFYKMKKWISSVNHHGLYPVCTYLLFPVLPLLVAHFIFFFLCNMRCPLTFLWFLNPFFHFFLLCLLNLSFFFTCSLILFAAPFFFFFSPTLWKDLDCFFFPLWKHLCLFLSWFLFSDKHSLNPFFPLFPFSSTRWISWRRRRRRTRSLRTCPLILVNMNSLFTRESPFICGQLMMNNWT